jgi:catechol 2,3-dioxygenase-like lactoylglutathione lyase family enzyme
MQLRSVELDVTNLAESAEFLEHVWRLMPAGKRGDTLFFRGTGAHHHILSLRAASAPAVTAITLSSLPEEVDVVLGRVRASGAPHEAVAQFDIPGEGSGFLVQGVEAQTYRFVAEAATAQLMPRADTPLQITHAVMNALDVAACEKFAVEVLGFKVSDRTRMMTFVRCNAKHHCCAYVHADGSSLNHIAFEMQDLDAVMRGMGRMRDAGFDSIWGPGRHGPGNNVFGYFIAPFNAVIEYTAEIAEVDEHYKVGSPEDWKWPPGRIDHWGLSTKDVEKAVAAERTYRFPASLPWK